MIVKASNSEENQFTASPNIMIEIKDNMIPKVNSLDRKEDLWEITYYLSLELNF